MKQLDANDKEMLDFVENFKEEFRKRFDHVPIVKYMIKKKTVPEVSLYKLEELANELINRRKYPRGVRTRSRYRDLILMRHMVFYISRNWGHSYESIADHFGFNHATVIHSNKVVDRLLDSNDPEIARAFTLITHKLEKEKNARNVHPDNGEETES